VIPGLVLEAQEPDEDRWREIRALFVDIHNPQPGEIKDTEPCEPIEIYQEEAG
jgi:hypothetical protein